MRKKFVFVWLASAIALFCIHYGPGQNWLRSDRVSRLHREAKALERSGNWQAAREKYDAALAALPADGGQRQRLALRISRAWTYLNTQDVAEATSQLEALLGETREKDAPGRDLMHDLRAALAHAEYYTAWHMRLENAPREEWLKELEVSRQNFRYLAETSPDPAARRNLEAAIFLARMDLADLQGLPLPEENSGKGSQNVSGKREGQKGQEGQEGEGDGQPGEGEGKESEKPPKDARGSGLGKRPDGIGS